ncbi:MAG: TraB/GumN family protein [Aquimonas sp.]|nr:TraB/GumN family protein [Aquimonas sp.]
MTLSLLPCAALLLALLVPTAAADPEPAGTEPAGTEPAGTEPARTEPARTEPARTEDELPIRRLDTVEVSAKVSGPGLWEIRSGDSVLWILGTQSPLPKRFQWESEELRARLAESSLLIAPPSVSFDAGVGRVRGLMLLPSLLRARRDPEARQLSEVVGPELYARWQPLKARYLGRERKVESWRPLFAALRLWEEAIEDARMTGSGPVWRSVSRDAKRRKIPIVEAAVSVKIDDAKSAIRSFSTERLDDLDCFERTLDRLESDLETMRLRAEAWAIGEIEILRSLPFSDQNAACQDAFLSASVAEAQGLGDLGAKLAARWLEVAGEALRDHRSSVAVLPIGSLLNPESRILQGLRERGFEVREPSRGPEGLGPEEPAGAQSL